MPSMPPIISFVARPDHGKTTVLEKLIPELTGRGLRVGTIKHHIHRFEMDKPGKDTWRHKQAGAHTVALSSPAGLGLIRDVEADMEVEELVARYFFDLDLVLTEGYKHKSFPKIEVFRKQGADTSPLPRRDGSWAAFVTDTDPGADLPCFGLDDTAALADFIIDRFLRPAAGNRAVLMVDDKVIPMNSFVESFLSQAVAGMISSLKGCRDPKLITISIRNEEKKS